MLGAFRLGILMIRDGVINPIYDYYVSLSGVDSGPGDAGSPWRTLAYALANVGAGARTIKMGPGTFIEDEYLIVPKLVTIVGENRDVTIIKGDATLNHTYVDYNYASDKYLFQLTDGSAQAGNQAIRDLTIEGNARAM